jgi:hypothetical protein
MIATAARAHARLARIAAVVVGALVFVGVLGVTAPSATAAAPRQPLPQTVCEWAGGLYVQEDGYFLCYLPDGSVVICADGVGCTTVPPTRRAAMPHLPTGELLPLTAA